jgi:hypothetical protein
LGTEIKRWIVEANSWGSMKLLTNLSNPATVETSWEEEINPTVPRPITVEFNWLVRYDVDTKFNKLGVETKPGWLRVAVDTKLRRLGVETRFKRLGTEINRWIDEANSWGSMKLLTNLSNPATVETSWEEEMNPTVPRPITVEFNWLVRYEVDTKLRRLGVETKPRLSRVAVDTKLRRFGVLTNPGWLRVAVETKLRRFGVETNPGARRVAVDTRFNKFGVETTPEILERYPREPRPMVVEVNCDAVTPAAAAWIWS